MIHPSIAEGLKWGSHLPILAAAVAATAPKIIVEIGVGHFSTPLLHLMCQTSGRMLISIEEDEVWGREIGLVFQREGHEFWLGKYDVEVPKVMSYCLPGVTFIDNSPGGDRRAKDFECAIHRSDLVVVHDFEGENFEAIVPILNRLEIDFYTYSRYAPNTLLAAKVGSKLPF